MAKDRTETINRLRRIEGQVRGILHQIHAVQAALGKVESAVLKDHAACCVTEAIASGDAAQQRDKFNELVDLFEKMRR